MNYISCPLLNIVVSEKSVRATYIAFMNQLINRIPFVCDRIYSYMEQDYFPVTSNKKRHVVAKSVDTLFGYQDGMDEKTKRASSVMLCNGWYLAARQGPQECVNSFISRIEEAIGIPIIVVFETNGKQNNFEDRAHRNINQVEYNLLLTLISK